MRGRIALCELNDRQTVFLRTRRKSIILTEASIVWRPQMCSTNCPTGALHLNGKWAVFLILCLLLPLLSFSHSQTARALGSTSAQPYTIAVNVRLVVLPVTVTNRKGLEVDGLSARNFRVYEDGRLQKPVLFEHKDVPVTVGLVIDNSSSMIPKRPEVKEAALAFAQSSNPHDEMFVVNFSDAPSF